MAQLYLNAPAWRMARRALKAETFGFDDVRNWVRLKDDRAQFDWLVENGFFAPAGDGLFALTDKGRAAADLGFYEV